jgi:hypothetical protein
MFLLKKESKPNIKHTNTFLTEQNRKVPVLEVTRLNSALKEVRVPLTDFPKVLLRVLV